MLQKNVFKKNAQETETTEQVMPFANYPTLVAYFHPGIILFNFVVQTGKSKP